MSPWTFTTRRGTLFDPSTVRRHFHHVLRQAGLPSHFTPHGLRHTFASQLLSLGESIQYVQQQLGHAHIKLTVNIYGRWLPAPNKAAVDRLDVLAHDPRGDRMVTEPPGSPAVSQATP